jgi:hypothetical protein
MSITMDFARLTALLGTPASYPRETREAVARLVADPLELGADIDTVLAGLEEDHSLLLDEWLTGEPEYPIVEALTVTQLACDFARFVGVIREITNIVPDEALPSLVRLVASLESAGIVSGDWSWCLSVAKHLLAVTKETGLADGNNDPAN